MIEVVVDKSQRSFWDPNSKVISLGEYSPIEFAHELAHARFEHGLSGSLLGDMVEEKDAWKEALRRLPPEEISLPKIVRDLSSYAWSIGNEYGYGSKQFQLASKYMDEVTEYAIKRKKEVR